MHRIFALRAYGDFIILLQSVLQSDHRKNFHIVASKHLEPIFESLTKMVDSSSISIEFVDFGIQKTLLSYFTNKYFFSMGAVKELIAIKQWLRKYPNTKGIDYLEQDKRQIGLSLIMGHSFKSILQKENVYESYQQFFQTTPKQIKSFVKNENTQLIIFPDSRLAAKNIPDKVLNKINQTIIDNQMKVQVAYFKKAPANQSKDISIQIYNSFDALLTLIEKADLVIGADSLPIHLANLLNKPHYILYPKGFTQLFITPWAKKQQYFGNFDDYQFSFIN